MEAGWSWVQVAQLAEEQMNKIELCSCNTQTHFAELPTNHALRLTLCGSNEDLSKTTQSPKKDQAESVVAQTTISIPQL